ncbi:hypothetical protein [Dactylosporangium sp. CA-233914]|uniref:hypothetical protein n=1 Tax=Dactylosporangium sp. CA-233914 TaxID=3239934 RepID=UPI003D8F2F99
MAPSADLLSSGAGRPAPRPPLALLAELLPVQAAGARGTSGRPGDPVGNYRPVIRALLRNAARGCAARRAELWLPGAPAEGAGQPLWRPAVRWRGWRSVRAGAGREGRDGREGIADPALLSTLDGVAATVEVPTAGGSRPAVLVLAHRDGTGLRSHELDLLGDTSMCLGLMLREAAARGAAQAARDEGGRALQRVGTVQLELATVLAVERDRLACAVTTTSGRQLRAVVEHTAALESALESQGPGAVAIVATIRAALLEMIEQFRAVVRGVYPQVLRGSGVAAALAEMAATLPVPVHFHGDLGRRQGWEVESGLYQAAASAVTALCAAGGDEPVRVELARDGDVLTIRLERAGPQPDRVGADLRDDTRRLAALGGRLSVASRPGTATVLVEIRLPERWGGDGTPPAPATGGDAGTVAQRLRDLLLSALGTPADGAPVRVAVDRQDARVRVAVVGPRADELVARLCGRSADRLWPSPVLYYQHGPVEQATVEPIGPARAWRRIRVPGWSGLDPSAAGGERHRVLLESPAPALRGLRLVHHRQRVDARLAAELCRWSDTADGPPDVVVLALDGLVTSAQSEFLGALRAPSPDGFAPVVICAHATGPGARPRLAALCDTVVGWPPGGDTGPVELALRGWVRSWSGLLAARWALRALASAASAGRRDDQLGLAVEAEAAGADELTELDLLDALRGRRIRLPHGHDDALRLLGAHGRDPRARLGLAQRAGVEQVSGAAARALAFWRTQAMRPDPGTAGRGAYASLVRISERLLTGAAHG